MVTCIRVCDAAKLIAMLTGASEVQALLTISEAIDRQYIQVDDTLTELQAENAYMRELLHRYGSCRVCANAADPYGLHCKFGGCNGGGNGAIKDDRWTLMVNASYTEAKG